MSLKKIGCFSDFFLALFLCLCYTVTIVMDDDDYSSDMFLFR